MAIILSGSTRRGQYIISLILVNPHTPDDIIAAIANKQIVGGVDKDARRLIQQCVSGISAVTVVPRGSRT
jgi:hypothetical protein